MFSYWESLVDLFVFGFLNLEKSSMLGSSLHFFIYDTVKIFILLIIISGTLSFLRTYLPLEQIRDFLSQKSPFLGHLFAAIFGFITPFCSCSAIPLFVGFLQARIPLGVVLSYLISAPMNNEIAFVLMWSIFGWKIAVLYLLLGSLVAIVAGMLLGSFKLESEILIPILPANHLQSKEQISLKNRLHSAKSDVFDILQRIWKYVIFGIGIGAFIHGYIPSDLVVKYSGGSAWYSVPMAVLIGAPMYNNAVSIIPLVEVLVNKGVLFGTALSFMMATSTFSLPEAIMLKRVMSWKLLALFYGITALGIIFNGYMFNLLLH